MSSLSLSLSMIQIFENTVNALWTSHWKCIISWLYIFTFSWFSFEIVTFTCHLKYFVKNCSNILVIILVNSGNNVWQKRIYDIHCRLFLAYNVISKILKKLSLVNSIFNLNIGIYGWQPRTVLNYITHGFTAIFWNSCTKNFGKYLQFPF